MRAIAEFIMRGRMQATLVVAAAAALPLLFWLSAAASALVLLRRGMQDAVTIVVWAVLPALAWWYFAEPRTLLVLLGTLSLAQLLRRTQSWVAVLLASVPLGLLFALVLGEQFQESIARLAQELNTLMQQQMGEILQQWPEAERARMDSLVVPVLIGLMAALLQLLSLLSLMLARYWQAALYNPGGFCRRVPCLAAVAAAGFWPAAGVVAGAQCGTAAGHAGAAVYSAAGLGWCGIAAWPGGAEASGRVLAGWPVCVVAAVPAADLSVADGLGHCRQSV